MRSREIYTNVHKTIKTGSENLSHKIVDRITNSKPGKKVENRKFIGITSKKIEKEKEKGGKKKFSIELSKKERKII